MSIFHALEDGVLNDMLHDLRLLKAVGGTLMSAAVSGDELEPEEIGSLACLVHDRSNNIMQTLLDLESKGGNTPAPPTPKTSEDWELDPITKENILKDAEKLQNMASQIQLTAEGMCHDLRLELPPNIKERIARQRASRMVKAPESPAQEAPTETAPLERGKALLAYFKSTYDFLNSAIAREPRIKEQLKELQGEAAELMEKFDDLLIDLDGKQDEAA